MNRIVLVTCPGPRSSREVSVTEAARALASASGAVFVGPDGARDGQGGWIEIQPTLAGGRPGGRPRIRWPDLGWTGSGDTAAWASLAADAAHIAATAEAVAADRAAA